MTQDVSGFGLVMNIIADTTFPVGVTIDQFADDVDPLDLPEMKTGDFSMGVNGDLIFWSKAMAIEIKVGVINGSDDDINLGILFDANRVAQGKTSARDNLTLTAVYPSGATITLTNGKVVSGMPGSSLASSGKFKSKTYSYVFQNIIKTGAI
jgi:hypothetical protein